jgi:hypothetical protein
LGSNRTFAYNSGTAISGTEQVGYIAVGLEGSRNYGEVTWWPGPDEDLGYIICHTSGERTAAQGTILVPAPTIGFWRSTLKTESSFVALANSILPGFGFTTGAGAATGLANNGYWSSYPPIYNTDALAYYEDLIAAGATIGYTTAIGLDTLFDSLQNNYTAAGPSFYSVLEGFYPILGTTPATQAINANGNTAYDLQFSGGWGRNSLGMQANGINTSAYTGKDYGLVTYEELWNTHFSIYGTVPNNTPINKADLSVGNGSVRTVSITLNNGRFEYDCGDGIQNDNPNSGNFVIISCDSVGSNTFSYINGSGGDGCGDAGYVYSTQGLYFGFGTSNFGGCQVNVGVSENTYGWASFGGFMSPTDMGNYQTIVNTFMTSIGRNTYTNP